MSNIQTIIFPGATSQGIQASIVSADATATTYTIPSARPFNYDPANPITLSDVTIITSAGTVKPNYTFRAALGDSGPVEAACQVSGLSIENCIVTDIEDGTTLIETQTEAAYFGTQSNVATITITSSADGSVAATSTPTSAGSAVTGAGISQVTPAAVSSAAPTGATGSPSTGAAAPAVTARGVGLALLGLAMAPIFA
ncbi:hypothetical protein FH972_025195 [Carpinus fangiana]|uniref:Uncharacterized protein n=1 Tax=Carpinus fangiana TaxID=176857 RepID=A0A5N6L0B4_9ROSI|nr:hypothetical protein FH972_025195 [Carpinus fangiana]